MAIQVDRLDAAAAEQEITALGALLVDVVNDGASIGFLPPFEQADAEAWWRSLLPDIDAGHKILFVARDKDGLVGTVQLHPARLPNGRNRADVAKLMVAPRVRRRGVATALMAALEDVARAHERTTLVLDTNTGSPAQRMYAAAGWHVVGDLPGFVVLADGSPGSTTFMYKHLGLPGG
jgi:GNAT superfamily N-acetyltransferase